MAESVKSAVIAGRGLLSRLGDAAIDANDSEEIKLRKSLLIFASGLMNIAAILWLAIYWWMGLKLSTSIPLGFQILSALVVLIYLRTRNFDFFRLAQLSLFLFFPFIIQWSIGSFVSSSGIALLAILAPIGAMVCYGPRESIPWFFAYVVLTILSGVFDFFLAKGENYGIPMRSVAVFFVMNFTIISTMVYLLLRYFVQERNRYEKQLAEQHELVRIEREKSERLLVSILPTHIAERLKLQPGTIADGFADVSVMFADVVDFTRMAEELTPNQVVSFLDEVFTRFDKLTAKYGLDKIKTIGDAYMVVGGLAGERLNYVDHVADMALEIMELTQTDVQLRRLAVQLHIGIATGPAIAGVIGATRFIYDLWGDTVNLSSRLTAEAAGGMILVDKTTYRRLGHRYSFDEPRTISIKGKGDTTVYRLTGKLYI
ncbi:MAG TPA: adenylate/guanylate cyclase domain-containing protein [Burkholderiales bacterium]|jgi:class 3 adenylate cyclase|nr:adenylate/guanylate cyclase domain-containing protein [Burkholderiales bacterium]